MCHACRPPRCAGGCAAPPSCMLRTLPGSPWLSGHPKRGTKQLNASASWAQNTKGQRTALKLQTKEGLQGAISQDCQCACCTSIEKSKIQAHVHSESEPQPCIKTLETHDPARAARLLVDTVHRNPSHQQPLGGRCVVLLPSRSAPLLPRSSFITIRVRLQGCNDRSSRQAGTHHAIPLWTCGCEGLSGMHCQAAS